MSPLMLDGRMSELNANWPWKFIHLHTSYKRIFRYNFEINEYCKVVWSLIYPLKVYIKCCTIFPLLRKWNVLNAVIYVCVHLFKYWQITIRVTTYNFMCKNIIYYSRELFIHFLFHKNYFTIFQNVKDIK